MTIDREYFNGPISFQCDAKRCTETDETHCTDFPSALAKMKSHGWATRQLRGEWIHICPICLEAERPL